MKNILIINGHPDKQSFSAALAKSYLAGAANSGIKSELINLIDLEFNPILENGYRERTELEPDLLATWDKIKSANHLVFVYPIWWGTQPALLKGFIDRLFLPKFAFEFKEGSVRWEKLLKGKTARIITTMDTPSWYYNLIYKRPGHISMKKGVLEFCGIKPVKISCFTPVKSSTFEKRNAWLKKVEILGEKGR